ncbi:HDOD domain-containing protein [Geovibrio thiophilus]|nr:HDOD domain-containing protein [Geovibrio thiophilus]
MEHEAGTILIVDDEQNILNSLKRRFFGSRVKVLTACGAAEALKIMSEHKVDLILSDYKMPDVNGIQLLTQIKEQYPYTFRAILSGYVETDAITHAIGKGIAMAYFKKPWNAYNLPERLVHIISTMQRIKDRELITVFSRIEKLPSLPDIYLRLDKAIESGASVDVLTNIFKEDVSLTAKIMQIGNSVFYGGKAYTTIEQTVLMIGLNAVREIVLMYKMAEQINCCVSEAKLAAVFRKGLILNKGVDFCLRQSGQEYNKSIASTAGLLSCIGEIILLCFRPERYEQTLKTAAEHACSFAEAEELLNIKTDLSTHITGYFLELYNIPFDTLEVLIYQQKPEDASPENRLIAAALLAVSRITAALEHQRDTDTSFYESCGSGLISPETVGKTAEMLKEILPERK